MQIYDPEYHIIKDAQENKEIWEVKEKDYSFDLLFTFDKKYIYESASAVDISLLSEKEWDIFSKNYPNLANEFIQYNTNLLSINKKNKQEQIETVYDHNITKEECLRLGIPFKGIAKDAYLASISNKKNIYDIASLFMWRGEKQTAYKYADKLSADSRLCWLKTMSILPQKVIKNGVEYWIVRT